MTVAVHLEFMIELLATLAPIALIDSLSVVPVAMIPLLILLGEKRPLAGSLSFIAGIVLTYLPFGLLLLFGLDTLFDSLTRTFTEWWSKEPDLGEIALEIIAGLAMLWLGYGLLRKKRETGETKAEPARKGMTPVQAFALAAFINVSGLWGALPYFAAIAQILKEDLSNGGMVSALLFYNLVFALPLLAFPVLYLMLGPRSEHWFARLSDFVVLWSGRALAILLVALGLAMIIDGIGWLNGTPIILPGARG